MKYTVIIEKHVTGYQMTYGKYDTFHDAAEALKYLKSVNTIDYCFIEETWFKGRDI